MKHLRFVSIVALSTLMACSLMSTVRAQQVAAPKPPDQLAPAPPMLKVTVVLSRVNGEKRVSNLPFVMLAALKEQTSVQMSSQTPLPTLVDGKSGFTYQNVGTRMTSNVSPLDGGSYAVNLTVDDSQVLSDAGGSGSPGRMQSFTVSTRLVLKDGGSVQFNAATDKTTGDVVKVDVTLNVIK